MSIVFRKQSTAQAYSRHPLEPKGHVAGKALTEKPKRDTDSWVCTAKDMSEPFSEHGPGPGRTAWQRQCHYVLIVIGDVLRALLIVIVLSLSKQQR